MVTEQPQSSEEKELLSNGPFWSRLLVMLMTKYEIEKFEVTAEEADAFAKLGDTPEMPYIIVENEDDVLSVYLTTARLAAMHRANKQPEDPNHPRIKGIYDDE